MISFPSDKDLLIGTEKFNGKSLKRTDDILLIIEAYRKKDALNEFEKLAFTGKYVNGLFKVLKSSVNIPEVESVNHIKKDLGENTEKVITYLKEICSQMSEVNKAKMDDNYLQLSKISLKNLQLLVEDLDDIKKYLNHLKRK